MAPTFQLSRVSLPVYESRSPGERPMPCARLTSRWSTSKLAPMDNWGEIALARDRAPVVYLSLLLVARFLNPESSGQSVWRP